MALAGGAGWLAGTPTGSVLRNGMGWVGLWLGGGGGDGAWEAKRRSWGGNESGAKGDKYPRAANAIESDRMG